MATNNLNDNRSVYHVNRFLQWSPITRFEPSLNLQVFYWSIPRLDDTLYYLND